MVLTLVPMWHLKLLVLLYTDDTNVFGTSKKDFQNNLDMFIRKVNYLLWLNLNRIFYTREDQHFDLNLDGH